VSALAKTLTGLCSLWPAAVALYVFFGPREHYGASASLGVAITFVVVLVYAFLVVNSNLVAPRRRGLWVVMLVLGSAAVLPVFWYMYIYSSPPITGAQQSRPADPD
jgi:glucan phosphoethanolaminetransferase (alkaline phosphatase superfamily)